LQPLSPGVLDAKAVALAADGQLAVAHAAFEEEQAAVPTSAQTWHNSGTLLLALDRYEEALEAFDRAITLDPALWQAWNNKGAALAKLGRHIEALAAFNQALALNPEAAEARIGKAEARSAHYREVRGKLLDVGGKLVGPGAELLLALLEAWPF
jgi:tetratricopeptide (TPR) repeat protein